MTERDLIIIIIIIISSSSSILCVCVLLLLLGLVLLRAVIKQLLVHLHEELQSVVDQTVDRPDEHEQ